MPETCCWVVVYSLFNHRTVAHACYLDLEYHLSLFKFSSPGSRYLPQCCPDSFSNPIPWFSLFNSMFTIYLKSLDFVHCFGYLYSWTPSTACTYKLPLFLWFSRPVWFRIPNIPSVVKWDISIFSPPSSHMFLSVIIQGFPMGHLYIHSPVVVIF